MDPKLNYTLVGAFVIVLGALAIVGVFWLSGAGENKRYYGYEAYMYESVSGLDTNATVKYRGVDVGFVSEIALDREDPQRVRLLLQIEHDVPIKEDTIAVLATQGITGVAHLELSGGSPNSPTLRTRGTDHYPVIQTGPSLFVRLDQTVTNLVSQLTQTASQLNRVADRVGALLRDENQRAITDTLMHVEALTGTLALRVERFGEGLDNLDIVLRNAATASRAWPDLMERAGDALAALNDTITEFGGVGESVDGATEAITSMAGSIETVMNETQTDLASFSRNLPAQMEQFVSEIQQVSESLRRVSLDLERDPQMLLFGRPDVAAGPGE